MKYYLLRIKLGSGGDNIFLDKENESEDTNVDIYELLRDQRFVDPKVVLKRNESIEIEGEEYETISENALSELGYSPSISTTFHLKREAPNLVFDKFKRAFSSDERFKNIEYHKVKVTPEMNLYRLIVPSIYKEMAFDMKKTTFADEPKIKNEKLSSSGYSYYQIKVEKSGIKYRNPVFREEKLNGLHAFKLMYDPYRIFVDEVFKKFCEENGFDDISFFDIEKYGYC